MNRVVWLPALILIAIAGTGCQSTKFPSPKWPDFAMFKKKDKDLAPPSEHFDVAEQTQLASNAGSDRKPVEIPGEAPAGAVKAPADLAKPTAAMVAGKSGSSSATAPNAETTPAANQPIRKPYEMARSGADSVKQAAGTLASDLGKSSQAAADQVARNANEVVGQFQQQGRDLANSANNKLNQAAADLNQKANDTLAAIAPATQPANSTSAGGAFAFNRPATSSPSASAAPPWSNPGNGQATAPAAATNPIASNPMNPVSAPVDPLKSLAAGAALPAAASTASNPSPSNGGFTPKPVAGADRQMQPINQQMVNQNLGAPTTNPSSTAASPQFQLPVAQPQAFVANRSSTPATGSASAPMSSTPKTSAPQFSPQNSAPIASAPVTSPSPGAATPNSGTTQSGSNKYPSTGFNAFAASGSNPPNPSTGTASNSGFTPAAATNSGMSAPAAQVNAEWKNQASPIAASSNSSEAAATRPVSHSAELPAELMQRSGGYAPGSIGGGSNGETLWR